MNDYQFSDKQLFKTIEWVNLSQYQNLVYNKTSEEKWPLKLYPTEEEGRVSTQSRCNDINIGAFYQPPECYKNNLSSSLEFTDTTETDYAPLKKSKQLNTISMQTLNT